MSDLERLGIALGEQLDALVEDLNPSTRLRESVAAISASDERPARRRFAGLRRRRIALVVSVPLASAAAALAFVLGGSTAAPAFAVTVRSDGAVLVTINRVIGVGPANAQLRSQGLRNVVVVRMSPTCRNHFVMSYLAGSAPSIGLTRHKLPRGVRVIVAALRIGPDQIEMAFGRTHGAVPACVTSHGTGPGLPGWRPSASG